MVPPLRLTLLADAGVCLVYALLVGGLAPTAAPWLVTGPAPLIAATVQVLWGVAAFVLVMGIYSAWTASAWPQRRQHVRAILAVEVLWCLACIALLLAGLPLTRLGQLAVVASGLGVGVFLIAEVAGYRAERTADPR
ncbi:MAG TPA: hypothetical protein VFV27_06780 [Nevskiaceae bacterium]|nr:hypothetical protein [Nevskiaceae bacterium]